MYLRTVYLTWLNGFQNKIKGQGERERGMKIGRERDKNGISGGKKGVRKETVRKGRGKREK